MNKKAKYLILLPTLLFVTSCSPSGDTLTGEYHNISFVSNGGTEYKDVSVLDGDYLSLPTPEKEDYEFKGWFDNADFEGGYYEGEFAPRKDYTFYAKWRLDTLTYTVRFIDDEVDDIKVKSNDNVIYLPVIERYGYHFNGWKLANNSEVYNGEYVVNSDLTFYPSFTEVSYIYLYINNSTDYIRLEYEPNTVVLASSLPTPDPYIIDGVECPFVKWVNALNGPVPEEISLGSDPIILQAIYDYSLAPTKYNLNDLGDGKYETTGKSIKAFHFADSVIGVWSMDLGVYKSNGGGCGIAFRISESGNDYPFEDEGTSYFAAVLGASGGLSISRVENGAYKSIASFAFDKMPEAFKNKYNLASNYYRATLTVLSQRDCFMIYVDRDLVYTFEDADILHLDNFQGTGFGYRSSAAKYDLSNLIFEEAKEVHLDVNGGNPFDGPTYYWDKANTLSLPKPTTSEPNRVFDAWYYDKECQNLVDVNHYSINTSTVLYASYRTPTHTGVTSDGHGNYNVSARAVVYLTETTLERYSVSSTITFKKGVSGSTGLIIRANIKADNSYESGNSFVAIQPLPGNGGFQFSKTDRVDAFTHLKMTSLLTGTEISSPVSLATYPQYFSEQWANKYNSAQAGEDISLKLTVSDYGNMLVIAYDDEPLFMVSDTSELYQRLDGKAIGIKSSATGVTYTEPVIEEMPDSSTTIHLDVNGGDPLEQTTVTWSGVGPIILPTPTTSVPNRMFEGWYYDQALTQKVDPVHFTGDDNTVLYANYRMPINTTVVHNEDGSTTLPSKTVYLVEETSYERYSVSADLKFNKSQSGSFGIFVRGNIKADNSYEAGNGFLAFQVSPSAGGLQVSKTGNGSNFVHQTVTSILTGGSAKSYIKLDNNGTPTGYFNDAWYQKFTNSASDEEITLNLRLDDYGDHLIIYFDNVALFRVDDLNTMAEGLDGYGIGFKSSAAGAKFENFKVQELADPNVTIHLDVNGGDPLDSDTVTWSGEGAIVLPTPTTSVPNRVFKGWYYDEELTQEVDVNNFVGDSNTVLHAKYGFPTNSNMVDNQDGTYTITKKSLSLMDEAQYDKYSVTTTLSFTKASGGSLGLFIRGNMTANDSYEAGNSYVAIQFIPSNGNFQFSKTGNGSNFAHQYVYSVLAEETVKSQVSVAANKYFPQSWVDKFANASTTDVLTAQITVEDLGTSINIYLDGVKVFVVEDTTSLYEGLNGKGVGIKTSSTNITFTNPVVQEII